MSHCARLKMRATGLLSCPGASWNTNLPMARVMPGRVGTRYRELVTFRPEEKLYCSLHEQHNCCWFRTLRMVSMRTGQKGGIQGIHQRSMFTGRG